MVAEVGVQIIFGKGRYSQFRPTR